MSSHIVSLAWDGHHKTLVSVLEKLLVNSHFVDCTIAVEGHKLKAHREILSAFSPFFELLFSEETENNPTVIISGISFRDLRSLVDFMYHGQLEVAEDRIQDLIDAAECLQIEGLGGGRREGDSGRIKDTTVLLKRPGIPHKQTGEGGKEESASESSKESEVKGLNYSNDVQLENSVVITCGTKWSSSVQNLMPNSEVQNSDIVSNMSLMPVQSTWSEIAMDSFNLQGEYVVKRELDSDGVENMNEPMVDGSRGMPAQSTQSELEMDNLNLRGEYVVKKEPGANGDENISEPMRDTSRKMNVFGDSGNSYENSGEETIDVESADSNVPNEKSANEVSMDNISPTSQLCGRDLTVSSVKIVLSNINVKLSSEPVEVVEPAEVPQDPLFLSEFDMKTEDDTLLSVDSNLISENDELSENLSQGSRITDMQMVEFMAKKNDCSGAASRCISESTSPQEVPAAFVKIQRTGRNEPAVGLMPGLLAGVNPHITPTTSHTTPVCDRDLSGDTGRDVCHGSNSADTYRCQICNRTFTRKRSIHAHMRIHAKDKLFRYDECNNPEVTSIKLKEYQHNESRRKLYKCTVCDFKSENRSVLSEHMRIHKGQGTYKCTECEYTSVHRWNLKLHQRIHSGIKPYKCTECDYRASQISHLKTHQRIHSGVKPYKCTECDYRASQMGTLKAHQRIHSGVKPYKCTQCDYRSSQLCNLRTHQRIHGGAKPYKCSECNYETAQIGKLRTHQRIHSGLKPYKCKKCDYRASQLSSMKAHQRIHSGVRPYKCTECDYRASKIGHLKTHQRIHGRVKC